MDRARGRDTQRVAVLFVRVSGVDWRPGEWNAGSLVSGEGVSHFLSEMSCGEVVAGSLLFPGRAFEFSSPSFFSPPVSTPLLAGPAALRPFCHWAATQDNESLKLRRKLGVISSHSILSNAVIALTPHHPVDPQCTCHAQHLSVIRVCLNSTSYVT